MRLEAERQQSESAHERGVRDPLGLMEPIVGALVEPRPRRGVTCKRPAEESRSIHDQSDEPHSPTDRLHHCLRPSCYRRAFDQVKIDTRIHTRPHQKTSRLNRTSSTDENPLVYHGVHPRSIDDRASRDPYRSFKNFASNPLVRRQTFLESRSPRRTSK